MFTPSEFFTLLHLSPTAINLLTIALTITLGVTLGRIRVGQVSIGVAGVLFAGIFLSHYGFRVTPEIIDFIREFGLILFVYTIGVQVGPRFFSNFKQNGVKLNILAFIAVLVSVLIALIAHYFGGIPLGATIGVLAGATTNTPSLGSAQQMIAQSNPDAATLSTIAYAIAYPMGIFGIIITILTLKILKKVDIAKEIHAYAHDNSTHVIGVNIIVENKNLNGIQIKDIPDYNDSHIVFSRMMHDNKIILPHNNTPLHIGDIIRAVGPKKNIEKLCIIIGSASTTALEHIDSEISGRWMVVTNQKAVGKTIQELNLRQSFRVTATRINHDGFEEPASNNTILYYGNSIWVVGENEDLEKFSKFIGDSAHALNHPFILPVFIGMILGILLGQIPIYLPGLPSPIQIGIVGGPLIVSILASRLGRLGHVVWYLPTSANHVMRKLGIALFLACVGLKSGAHFVETVMTTQGIIWFAWGCAITIIPLLLIGTYALWKMKLNFLTVCGLLAGSLTNPPGLVFANNLAHSNGQSVAYSTIYPLVMIMRVVAIQILVIILSMG